MVRVVTIWLTTSAGILPRAVSARLATNAPVLDTAVVSRRRVCCEAAHFLRHQLAVWALALHQAMRRAVFDDLACSQHHHPIEAAQRRKAVRDGDDGAAVHQPRERFADRLLGLAVECGRGFI